jgi:hypothetical protein
MPQLWKQAKNKGDQRSTATATITSKAGQKKQKPSKVPAAQ